MRLALLLVVIATFVAIARSECPNACSGHGKCGPKDMCTCYKNFQGNDCSLWTCPYAHAHVDTPRGDLNMDGSITNADILSGSDMYPSGVREQFPTAASGESHFYMECANKGICDRTTGLCTCFPGYEGSACQRASCPNACSGHGTCESIKELAENAGGTVYGNGLASGGQTYALWDAKITYGCKCDPGYEGADCSARLCKYGIDPMYEAEGTPVYEITTFRILGASAPSGSLRLRFYDHFGEAYVTAGITVGDDSGADYSSNFATAFQALPNSVIPSVTCAKSGAGDFTHLPVFKDSKTGTIVSCKFTGNPGKLRLVEVADKSGLTNGDIVQVLSSVHQGEDVDRFATKSGSTGTTLAADGTALTISAADANLPATGLFKVNGFQFVGTYTGTTITLIYPWKGAALSSATAPLHYSKDTVAATTWKVDSWAVGDFFFITDADPTTISVGKEIIFHNQLFTVQKIEISAAPKRKVTVNRPFAGTIVTTATFGLSIATGGTDVAYVITRGTTGLYEYVSQCSGRGLCDGATGVCTCFKGFTNDNCDTQNVMAL